MEKKRIFLFHTVTREIKFLNKKEATLAQSNLLRLSLALSFSEILFQSPNYFSSFMASMLQQSEKLYPILARFFGIESTAIFTFLTDTEYKSMTIIKCDLNPNFDGK